MDWKEKYEVLYNQLASIKYGMKIDFPTIERKLSHLREGDAITYEDLETVAREDLWPFKKYWMWPAKEQIEDKLEKSWDLIVDPIAKRDAEGDMICGLLDIFKHISLMSILLRFVWPEHYAIYSRASLQLLQIERGHTDEQEYMNYLAEMRTLRLSFGVERTADVDMIVWVCTQREEAHEELCEHLKLRLPGELSPMEVIKESRDDPLRMAELYLAGDSVATAGFWAARAFEKTLREDCRRLLGYVPKDETREYGDLEYLVRCLCKDRSYHKHESLLVELKRLRNDAVHEERTFNRKMAQLLIDGVRELILISKEASAGLI
jgi:hypothetical protein